jgi:hypothetical protein
MKVLTYTETGPGTLPGPACPDYFFNDVCRYLVKIIDRRFRKRILLGCNVFGHEWPDITLTDANYVEFHEALQIAIFAGTPLITDNAEQTNAANNSVVICGSSSTVVRATDAAKTNGFIGASIWKLDDGDKYECFPHHPTLHPAKSPWKLK